MLYAAGQGIEPRLTVPKTAVLPLDDPAIRLLQNTTNKLF